MTCIRALLQRARVRALAVLIIKCLFAVMPQTRSKSKKENLEAQTRASARPLSHSPAMRAPGDLFLFFSRIRPCSATKFLSLQ